MVVDADGKVQGRVSLAHLENIPADEQESTRIESIMQPATITITADATLDTALGLLSEHQLSSLPVVEGRERRPLGIVGARGILRAYRTAARASTRWLHEVTLTA